MRVQDHSMYFNYFQMLPSTFDDLLGLVGPSLVRKTTNLGKLLPPQLRMAVASRYLATGESQASLSFNYRIGRSTVCQILDEVPEKILEALSPLSVAQPNTPENWKRLADDFWNLWGFPLFLGALDGKHCVINCPPNSGSAFFNYQGTFSIVFMAVVDGSYMFTFVDIGDFGRQCDSSVFNNSPFGESLNKGRLNIPVHGHLPNTDTKGHPEKAIKNVLASVALHNWLKKHEDTQQVYGRFYCPVGYTDYEDSHGILHKGTWRNEVSESGALQNIGKMGTNNYSKAAEYYRSLLADYFLSPQGELPWQYDYICRTSYDPDGQVSRN
eukprot:gene5638-10859_t